MPITNIITDLESLFERILYIILGVIITAVILLLSGMYLSRHLQWVETKPKVTSTYKIKEAKKLASFN
jgi:hypothetical protein